jgi:hypothetical protein
MKKTYYSISEICEYPSQEKTTELRNNYKERKTGEQRRRKMFKDRRAEILGWFCRGFGKVRKMKFGNNISTLSGGKFKKLNSKNIDKSMFNIFF